MLYLVRVVWSIFLKMGSSLDKNNLTKRRVVVTGMGCITPYGIGLDLFWNNLINGKSAIREHTFHISNISCIKR